MKFTRPVELEITLQQRLVNSLTAMLLSVPLALAYISPAFAADDVDPLKLKRPTIQFVTEEKKDFGGYFTTTTYTIMPITWSGQADWAQVIYPKGFENPNWRPFGEENKFNQEPVMGLGYGSNCLAWMFCTPTLVCWPNFHLNPEFKDVLLTSKNPKVLDLVADTEGEFFRHNLFATLSWVGLFGGAMLPYALPGRTGGIAFNSSENALSGGLALAGVTVPLICWIGARWHARDRFGDAVHAYNKDIIELK